VYIIFSLLDKSRQGINKDTDSNNPQDIEVTIVNNEIFPDKSISVALTKNINRKIHKCSFRVMILLSLHASKILFTIIYKITQTDRHYIPHQINATTIFYKNIIFTKLYKTRLLTIESITLERST
uniref:hypothetical protein n=1 Tax=Bacteroides caccae TaxID=47678 RepID=UPI00359C32AF